MLEKTGDINSCPLMYAVSTFSGKWKPFIVWYISMSPNQSMRYGELRQAMPYKISHKMFIQHLRELEEDGVIERTVHDQDSVLRVDYSLTEKGRSLATILYMLRDWGSVYGDFDSAAVQRSVGVSNGESVIYHLPGQDSGDGASPTGGIVWCMDIDEACNEEDGQDESDGSQYEEPLRKSS